MMILSVQVQYRTTGIYRTVKSPMRSARLCFVGVVHYTTVLVATYCTGTVGLTGVCLGAALGGRFAVGLHCDLRLATAMLLSRLHSSLLPVSLSLSSLLNHCKLASHHVVVNSRRRRRRRRRRKPHAKVQSDSAPRQFGIRRRIESTRRTKKGQGNQHEKKAPERRGFVSPVVHDDDSYTVHACMHACIHLQYD